MGLMYALYRMNPEDRFAGALQELRNFVLSGVEAVDQRRGWGPVCQWNGDDPAAGVLPAEARFTYYFATVSVSSSAWCIIRFHNIGIYGVRLGAEARLIPETFSTYLVDGADRRKLAETRFAEETVLALAKVISERRDRLG